MQTTQTSRLHTSGRWFSSTVGASWQYVLIPSIRTTARLLDAFLMQGEGVFPATQTSRFSFIAWRRWIFMSYLSDRNDNVFKVADDRAVHFFISKMSWSNNWTKTVETPTWTNLGWNYSNMRLTSPTWFIHYWFECHAGSRACKTFTDFFSARIKPSTATTVHTSEETSDTFDHRNLTGKSVM